MGQLADLLPLIQFVQLDHGTVDIKGEKDPLAVAAQDLLVNLPIVRKLYAGGNGEAQRAEPSQALGMGLEAFSRNGLNVENENIQFPLGGDGAGKLAQGSCRGVSRIGKEGLSRLLPPTVQLLKVLLGHKYLSPHHKTGDSFVQHQGNGGDGF